MVEEAAELLDWIWTIQVITPGHPIQGAMISTMTLLVSHLDDKKGHNTPSQIGDKGTRIAEESEEAEEAEEEEGGPVLYTK